MSRILLTSVFRPFGIENKYNKKGDELLLDYLASRLTREPGLFSLSNYLPTTALHLIAANLPVETKILDYPSLEEFKEEVKKGYEYVGISFVYKGTIKVIKMISIIRKFSPKSKIILGGFGTDVFNVENLEADYVCREEGVGYMRRLLGLPEDEKKINPNLTAELTLKVLQKYHFIEKPKIGLITSGFGCPFACEFCCTSAYYGHKHVPYLENGEDIYRAMKCMNTQGTHKVKDFLIFEEDFMIYKKRVNQLGRKIMEDKDEQFTFACFSSIRSLSGYDLEELVAMGMGHVWIGVESVKPPFKKRSGRDINEVFDELHSMGVTTTGSIIFGLDHHTPANLHDEINFLISLYPSTNQISNLMPSANAPVNKRLEQASRLREFNFKDTDLYSEVVKHPNFEYGDINAAIFKGYETIYNTLGPSIFRVVETWFTGYKNLKKSSNTLLKKRAEALAAKVKGVLPVFFNTTDYLPNENVRETVKITVDEIMSELGGPTPDQKNQGELIGKIFALEDAKKRYLEEEIIEPEYWVDVYGSGFHEKYMAAMPQ